MLQQRQDGQCFWGSISKGEKGGGWDQEGREGQKETEAEQEQGKVYHGTSPEGFEQKNDKF